MKLWTWIGWLAVTACGHSATSRPATPAGAAPDATAVIDGDVVACSATTHHCISGFERRVVDGAGMLGYAEFDEIGAKETVVICDGVTTACEDEGRRADAIAKAAAALAPRLAREHYVGLVRADPDGTIIPADRLFAPRSEFQVTARWEDPTHAAPGVVIGVVHTPPEGGGESYAMIVAR